jgi:hypothetical protein
MENQRGKNRKMGRDRVFLIGILVLEVLLILVILSFLSVPLIGKAYAVVNHTNVTVVTLLQVGNVFPTIEQVRVNFGTAITLVPNATANATVYIVVRDYNGEADIQNVSVVLFHNSNSAYGSGDDNNRHYTNATFCAINSSFGDIYQVNITCSVPLHYYAEPGTWNATIVAYDNATLTDLNSTTFTVNTLLALGLPNTIDYGIVNATEVSTEKEVNVTNFGNTIMNLSVRGYAIYSGDNLSMNCTLGSIKNISVHYEKYNITNSLPGPMNLTEFQSNYTNLTGSTVVRRLDLPYRQNDVAPFTDDTNSTYWRIYVPLGVAGSCRGNIVFGAVQSTGL